MKILRVVLLLALGVFAFGQQPLPSPVQAGGGSGSITPNTLFKGTTATDSSTLGPELTSASGWTSTGWTGAYNAFTHNTGNTTALSTTIPSIVAGNIYQVVITVSAQTAGTITFSIGGVTVTQPSATPIGPNGVYTAGPQALTTDGFLITPTSTFNGTVAVSIKLVTCAAASSINIQSSGGTTIETISQLSALQDVGLFGPSTIVSYVGNGSLTCSTTGGYNTAFGPNAPLATVTTGQYNSAYGGGSLRTLTAGWYNTAVGDDSQAFNQVGYNNTSVGVDALYQNLASNNTAVGFTAAINNTTGVNNVAVGSGALAANQTANNNTAIGTSSLPKNTGADNVGLGTNTLLNSVGGSESIGIGYQALSTNTASLQNVAIGSSSLFCNTSSGNSNVAVGHASGYTETPANCLTSGSGNTFIGAFSGPNAAANQNFSFAIGYQAHTSASNHGVLGDTHVTDVYLGTESATANLHAANVVLTGTSITVGAHVCTVVGATFSCT